MKRALLNIRRTPYQAGLSICVLTVSFFFMYLVSMVIFGSDRILRYFETRPFVIAFFKDSLSEQDVITIASEVRSKGFVDSVNLVTKDDALGRYKKTHKDELINTIVTPELLLSSIEIRAKSLDQMDDVSDLMKQYGDRIDEIQYPEDVVPIVRQWTTAIRNSGLIIAGAFALVSLITMNSILLLKLVSKKHEIHVMDLLGASWWYIARPFLIEGIVYGILGSLFAWLIAFGGLMYATPALLDIFGAIPVLPYPDWFFALQAAVGAGVGLIMGIIAVLLALLRLFR